MQQVGDWLAKLGLAEYTKCFAENRIDISVLPDLTDQHLKDLGLPLGDRLKMLRAIRSFPVLLRYRRRLPLLSQKARAFPRAAMPRQYRPVHRPRRSQASAATSR